MGRFRYEIPPLWSVISFYFEGEMAWATDERNYAPGFEDIFGLSPGARYNRRLLKSEYDRSLPERIKAKLS
jgi:hypothetical protein